MTLHGIARVMPPDLYRVGELALDARSAAFAAVVAAAAVLMTALVPAVRVGRGDLGAVLRSGGPSSSAAPRSLRLQHVLIGIQVCASVALVAATFTALSALRDLARQDTGFDRARVLTMKFILGPHRYVTAESVAAFHQQLNERLRQISGVRAAATVDYLPLNHETPSVVYSLPGETHAPGTRKPTAIDLVVSPGYFEAMGIALREGRDFDSHDTKDGRRVAVINTAFSERLWPGAHAVGRSFELGDGRTAAEVVGVVSNARHEEIAGPEEPIVYRPMAQAPRRYARIVVRTTADPLALTSALQHAVWSIDAALAAHGSADARRRGRRVSSDSARFAACWH